MPPTQPKKVLFASLAVSLTAFFFLSGGASAAALIEGLGPVESAAPGAEMPSAAVPQQWAPALEGLNEWAKTDEGVQLLASAPELRNLAAAINTPAIAPLLRAADQAGFGARLRDNIAALAAAPKAQKASIVKAVAADFETAGRSAAGEIAGREKAAPAAPGALERLKDVFATPSPSAAKVPDELPADAGKSLVVQGSGQQQSGRGPTIIIPSHRDVIEYGGMKFPVAAYPTEGTDIVQLWLKAHDASDGADIAMYNFDEMDMAQSIVQKSKQGKPQRVIGDYSNFFPEKLSQTNHGGQHQERTPAMQLLVDNISDNLQLRILKGLGSIGINHNKYTRFLRMVRNVQEKMKQGGSFNYTHTSQDNHWENVDFTDDGHRIGLFENYFEWMWSIARVYSDDLEPENPVFDKNHPIPADAQPSLDFHGAPFPVVSFSPNGETDARLVQAIQLVQKELFFLMFSPFPPQDQKDEILKLLQTGKDVLMISDQGQAKNALPHLLPLIDAGMQFRELSGPNATKNPHGPYNEHEKMHEKVMGFDVDMADALVKAFDSLNDSTNAVKHNFENNQFFQGAMAAIVRDHFRTLWPLAHAPSSVTMTAARAEAQKQAETLAKGGAAHAVIPWTGEPAPTE